jgi:putative membrane protein
MLNDGAALAKHLMVVPVMPDEGRTMMKEHADSMRALRAKSGADFDRAYIEHEIDMHQKVLDQVQKAVKEADRTDLRYLLEKTRPDLEDHLKEAQDIRKRLAS